MPDLIGQIFFNRYRVDEFIVLTPIGKRFRATDLYKNNPAALTILPQSISNHAGIMKKLQDEFRGASHPHIAASLGLFQTAQSAFIVEDWIDGPSLRDVIAKSKLEPQEQLVFAKAICEALDGLHKQNLLHLNLCPELIHINRNGAILLSGVGMSALGATKAVGYPPLYKAPEQFIKQQLTPAADIYSLAVILYQSGTGYWLNGTPPPKGAAAIQKVHLFSMPPEAKTIRHEIPPNYSLMLQWALRKDPNTRLKNTTEFITSLALALQTTTEAIPGRVTPDTAPAAAKTLSKWKFLPTTDQVSIANDAIPLDDRLSILKNPRSRKPPLKYSFSAALILLVVMGLFGFFLIVRPAEKAATTPTPIQNTPFAQNISSNPAPSPTPLPTDIHGGRIAFTCTRGNYNQICMINRDGSGLSQLTSMDTGNYYPVFSPDGKTLLFVSNRNGLFDLYAWEFQKKELTQITNWVGNVISPSYSPDGRKILFANKPGSDPTSLWLVNSDGLNPRLLYQGRNDIVAAAWSPSGEKIAYAMSDGIPQEYQIHVMDANGKNHFQISKGLSGIGGSLDWSPDGQSLLIHAGFFGDKNIFQIDLATQKFIQLTNGGNNAGAVYSPDGRYIVFNSQRNDEQADLYIMRVNGENQTQLTNDPEPDWSPHWTP